MLTLPDEIINLFEPFEILFHTPTWKKVQILLIGAILSPGKRTVSSALRVMGLGGEANFALYHHVLNRARWSSLELSRVLLGLLIRYLAPEGPLVFGMDETVERRRGKRISAKGIYRDGVRSSKGHFVKASGLRWISLMYLAYIPFAGRIWALPFLTVLAPSERYYQKLGQAHKKLTHWAIQMISQLRRWLPDRYLVMVASYSVLELLKFCQSLTQPVTFITRLRLDAALHELPPPRRPSQKGRPRIVGMRLPTIKSLLEAPTTSWVSVAVNWYDATIRELQIVSDTALWYNRGKGPVFIRWVLIRDPFNQLEPQALLCTDMDIEPVQIIEWFVMRWQLEVTFQEARKHLGVETQRQWSDRAIARTTPVLFGLFSWVTLASHLVHTDETKLVGSAAWYDKPLPTFSDAIASVRRTLWPTSAILCMSDSDDDIRKIPRALLNRMIDTLCYAA